MAGVSAAGRSPLRRPRSSRAALDCQLDSGELVHRVGRAGPPDRRRTGRSAPDGTPRAGRAAWTRRCCRAWRDPRSQRSRLAKRQAGGAGQPARSACAPPPLAKLPEQDGHQAAWLFVLDVHAAQVLLELGHPAPVLFRPARRLLLRLVVAALAHDPRGVGRTRRRSWGWKQASPIRRSRATRRSVKRGPGGRRPGSGIRAIRSLPSSGRVCRGHTDGRHRPIGRRP
jgi:hypothetical protein